MCAQVRSSFRIVPNEDDEDLGVRWSVKLHIRFWCESVSAPVFDRRVVPS